MSCATPTRCFAVGFYFDGSDYKTLVQHLNGTRWSIVDQPQPARRNRERPERRVVSEHDEVLRRRHVHDRIDVQDADRALERDELVGPRQPDPGRRRLRCFERRVVSPGELLRRRQRRRVHPRGALGQRELVDRRAALGGFAEPTRGSVVSEYDELLRRRELLRRLDGQDVGRTLERDELVDRAEPEPGRHCL